MMKTINFTVLLLIILSGCSSVQIYSDFDRTADFRKYRSFAWLQTPDSVHDLNYNNPLAEKNLKYFVNNEMKKRGYSVDIKNPDLLFQYHTSVERKQQLVSNPVYSNPAYSYYGPYRYGRSPYNYYNNMPYITGYTTQVIDYNEETIVIDIIDRVQNQLIWRGWAVGTDYDGNINEASFEREINKIFKKYPIQIPKRK